MSRRRRSDAEALPQAANDNTPPTAQIAPAAQILIPKDLPVLQIEVEVIAALLDDWPVANDNERP